MKIGTIQQICKGAKRIELYTPQSGVQWIGDGGAMYPLYNIPRLDGENVFTMFDIPEGKRSKIHLWEHDELPQKLDLGDACDEESLIEKGNLSIVLNGRQLIPLKTSMGLVYINQKYLIPFTDSENGVQLYERTTQGGAVYIVVKEGFLLTGIIFPCDVITQGLLDELLALYSQSKVALENKSSVRGGFYGTCQKARLHRLKTETEK